MKQHSPLDEKNDKPNDRSDSQEHKFEPIKPRDLKKTYPPRRMTVDVRPERKYSHSQKEGNGKNSYSTSTRHKEYFKNDQKSKYKDYDVKSSSIQRLLEDKNCNCNNSDCLTCSQYLKSDAETEKSLDNFSNVTESQVKVSIGTQVTVTDDLEDALAKMDQISNCEDSRSVKLDFFDLKKSDLKNTISACSNILLLSDSKNKMNTIGFGNNSSFINNTVLQVFMEEPIIKQLLEYFLIKNLISVFKRQTLGFSSVLTNPEAKFFFEKNLCFDLDIKADCAIDSLIMPICKNIHQEFNESKKNQIINSLTKVICNYCKDTFNELSFTEDDIRMFLNMSKTIDSNILGISNKYNILQYTTNLIRQERSSFMHPHNNLNIGQRNNSTNVSYIPTNDFRNFNSNATFNSTQTNFYPQMNNYEPNVRQINFDNQIVPPGQNRGTMRINGLDTPVTIYSNPGQTSEVNANTRNLIAKRRQSVKTTANTKKISIGSDTTTAFQLNNMPGMNQNGLGYVQNQTSIPSTSSEIHEGWYIPQTESHNIHRYVLRNTMSNIEPRYQNNGNQSSHPNF